MTKKDDPFAQTELGTPAANAFARPGKTVVMEPDDDELEGPVTRADHTAFAFPLPEALVEAIAVPAPAPAPTPAPAPAIAVDPDQTAYGIPLADALADQTAFGAPVADALADQTAFGAPLTDALAEPTAYGAPLVDALASALASPRASRTILGAPSEDAIAAWDAHDKGFTEMAPGVGMGGGTELGANRPGMTLPGGLPPEEAFTPKGAEPPRERYPLGFTQPSQTDFGAVHAWEAAAAHADREIERARTLHGEGVRVGKAGQFAQADALLRESLDLLRRYRPPGDILIAHGAVSLGTLYFYGRRPDLAEPLYREAWMLHRQGLGDRHPETAGRAVELARVLVLLGRIPEAYGFLRGAHEVFTLSYGAMHQATLEVLEMMRHLYG